VEQLLDAIRSAIASDATAEQKAAGAQACRTVLAALDAELGKSIALPGVPSAGPLAGLQLDQALDLIIARLRAAAPADNPQPVQAPRARPLQIALVTPPRRR
jgi:hypothetical protein